MLLVTTRQLCNSKFQSHIRSCWPLEVDDHLNPKNILQTKKHKHLPNIDKLCCQWWIVKTMKAFPRKSWLQECLTSAFEGISKTYILCGCPIVSQRTPSLEDFTNHFIKTLLRMSFIFLSVNFQHLKLPCLFPCQHSGLRAQGRLGSSSRLCDLPQLHNRGIVIVFCGAIPGYDSIVTSTWTTVLLVCFTYFHLCGNWATHTSTLLHDLSCNLTNFAKYYNLNTRWLLMD